LSVIGAASRSVFTITQGQYGDAVAARQWRYGGKTVALCFRVGSRLHDGHGPVVSVYLRVREGDVAETKEIKEGVVHSNYDSAGLLLGIELLGPCQIELLGSIGQREPEPIKRFLKGAAPGGLICT
jgi:hypothetical protein